MFKDRVEAGKKLAEALSLYKGEDAIIYALPRGGVVVGFEVAKALNLPLDLVITRKIGHPMNPEYALCATTETGEMLCDESARASVDEAWLEKAALAEQKEAKRRREVYLGDRQSASPQGKIAIVVDDGIATGLTIRSAVNALRAQNPQKIVIAVPAAPSDISQELTSIAEEVVVLSGVKQYLGAVGAYYEEFPQIKDAEVTHLIQSISNATGSVGR